MKNRIPPPILTLLIAGLMGVTAVRWGGYQFSVNTHFLLGAAVAVLGLAIMVNAAMGFRKKKTTVNPFRPDKTSELVFEGMYRFTRNPMYLGMAGVLIGAAIVFGVWPNAILVAGFIVYMTLFQIIPEERALVAKFGSAYADYMQRVRRWI